MPTDVTAIEERLAELSPQREPTAYVDALCDLAWALRFNDRERARETALEARRRSVELGYALGQGRAARSLAMTTTDLKGMREVFAYAEEARSCFDLAGDKAGGAAARDFLATLYEYIGDLSTAMELALEALSLAREAQDPVRIGYALSNVGGVLGETGDCAAARECLLEALALFESVADAFGVQRICSRLSKVCRQQGNLDEAVAYVQRQLELAQGRDPVDMATALDAMADIELDRNDHAEAERLMRQALAALGDDEGAAIMGAHTLIKLGTLLTRRGALDEAEAALTQGRDHFALVGVSYADQAWAEQALSEVAERRGDLATANGHLREVIRLKERSAENDTRQKLAQLELRAEMHAARQEAEIHRLKFVELSTMQAKLVQAQKMAQLGALAAGTAHELNSPLGVLRSNLDVYARAVRRLLAMVDTAGAGAGVERDSGVQPTPARLSEALACCAQTSEEALSRIGAVAEHFRRFTGLDQPARRAFDLNDGMRSALSLLRPNLPANIALHAELDTLPPLVGWPSELNQAFMTILLNAGQAIDGEGEVRVRTALRDSCVWVEITDTGRGMEPAQCEALFDVGFATEGGRTKLRLGLSAAQSTIQRHGGRIDVSSTPGQGTQFRIVLPVGEPAAANAGVVSA